MTSGELREDAELAQLSHISQIAVPKPLRRSLTSGYCT